MSTHELTHPQAKILNHALGLVDGRGDMNKRNHFVSGAGDDDLRTIKVLQGAGLMGESPRPSFCHPDDLVFHVTKEGKDALAAYRWPSCCCPPPGYTMAWASGPCPVHQGLRARGNSQ